MNLALIGRTNWLLDTGKELYKNGFKIKLIITSENANHDTTKPKDFVKLAKQLDAEYINSKNINSLKIKKKIQSLNLTLGVSINNLLIIKKDIISLFDIGIINVHAGDLPKYMGNACPNWAILKGEKKIGLTIHFMNEKLDAGNILTKKYFQINKNTTIKDFYDFADLEIPKLFLNTIKKISSGNYKLYKQNEKNILRTYPRNKIDGKINWNKKVEFIEKIIRISGEPFFGAYTYLDAKKLFILKAEKEYPKFNFFSECGQVVERKKNGDVVVSCIDGFLKIKKIKYNNKIYEKPSEIIKSIHTRLGMDIEKEIEEILTKINILLNRLK